MNRDTTELSNTILIALVAISALAFTFAQTTQIFIGWRIPGRYDESINFEKLKVKVALAGVAFFVAAIYLMLASALKYLALNPPPYFDLNLSFLEQAEVVFVQTCRILASGLFFGLALNAVQGLNGLYYALRKFRDPVTVDVEDF